MGLPFVSEIESARSYFWPVNWQSIERLSKDWIHFGKLMVVAGLLSLLLILQPDFGSVVLILGTYIAIIFGWIAYKTIYSTRGIVAGYVLSNDSVCPISTG